MSRFICDKRDETLQKCTNCPHGKDHYEIIDCSKERTKCCRNLDLLVTVDTRCRVLSKEELKEIKMKLNLL